MILYQPEEDGCGCCHEGYRDIILVVCRRHVSGLLQGNLLTNSARRRPIIISPDGP